MGTSLDHVMFACESVAEVTELLDGLGLEPEYGGVHDGGETEMAMLGFDDGTYLEFIAPTDRENPPAEWPEGVFSAGPCRWCLEADDLDATVQCLERADVPVHGTERSSREGPDGTVVEYESATYGPPAAAGQLPFLISDVTPREWRVQQSGSVDGTALTGVERVVVATGDAEDSVALFQRAHDYPAPRRQVDESYGAELVSFPGEPLVLAEPLDDGGRLAERIESLYAGPCAFLIGTASFEATRDRFDLTDTREWFGSRVAWFDTPELHRLLGVVEATE